MEIRLIRKYRNVRNGSRIYCIGKLSIDGEYICDTIEDKDYGWNESTSLAEIKATKAAHPSKTAIPRGRYEVTLNVASPKYSSSPFYQQYANGARVPRLLNVRGFEGVLIHTGNDETASAGCLIVGYNTQVGKVLNSREAFKKLYRKLQGSRGKIYINIE